METNDIVELQAKKLDNEESKEDPHVMLIDDILLEKKFRDTVLVFMNDSSDMTADIKRKCKEVRGSHTIKKKRCKKYRQTTESPNMEDDCITPPPPKMDSSNVQKKFYIWINIGIIIRYYVFMCILK